MKKKKKNPKRRNHVAESLMNRKPGPMRDRRKRRSKEKRDWRDDGYHT